MRSIIDNKKGQFDFPIVTFAIIVLGLILLAPIILKVVRSTVQPFADTLGNESSGMGGVGGDLAEQNTKYILGVFVNFWDGVILFAFLIALIMLFVSAFLIDVNPFFIILYILVFFLTIMFAPEILGSIDKIYEANAYAEEVALIGFIDFLRLNFGLILTAIGVLTMVIMYAKVRYFPANE